MANWQTAPSGTPVQRFQPKYRLRGERTIPLLYIKAYKRRYLMRHKTIAVLVALAATAATPYLTNAREYTFRSVVPLPGLVDTLDESESV